MKRLLLSTAMLGALASAAGAQDIEIFRGAADPMEIRASDLMGMRIYASEAAVEGDEFEGIQEGWEDIGEVNDVILGRDGTVQAVLVDIGGFLGIGERQAAVSMEALRFVSDSATPDLDDDYFLVMNAARADLEAAPEYVAGEMGAEEAAMETEEAVDDAATATAAAGTEVADEATDAGEEVAEEADQLDMTDAEEDVAEAADETADSAEETAEAATETEMEAEETAEAATDEAMATDEVAATDEAMATEDATTTVVTTDEAVNEEIATEEMATEDMAATDDGLARTPITREGFLAVESDALTADILQGAAVYDANDERVGEISELLLTEDGQITDLVVDVGGFLGIGEKPVAMQMGTIDILQQEGGGETRVYLSETREQLEAMPTYEPQ